MLRHLVQPLIDRLPVNRGGEGVDVVGAFEAVVDHEGVLEDIHDEERGRAGQVTDVVLVDPDGEEPLGHRIDREYSPADAAHGADGFEFFHERVDGSKLFHDFRLDLFTLFERDSAIFHVAKIELVQTHAVPLPAEAAAKLGSLGGGELVLGSELGERVDERVRVFHVPLVEREMILEERVAESLRAEEVVEIDWFKHMIRK